DNRAAAHPPAVYSQHLPQGFLPRPAQPAYGAGTEYKGSLRRLSPGCSHQAETGRISEGRVHEMSPRQKFYVVELQVIGQHRNQRHAELHTARHSSATDTVGSQRRIDTEGHIDHTGYLAQARSKALPLP